MAEINYELVELVLWIGVAFIIALLMIYFLNRAKKEQGKAKGFNLAAASTFMALFFDSIKRVIAPGDIFFIFLSNVAIVVFSIPLVYYLEKNIIRKTKQILSFTSIILIIIYIIIVVSTGFLRQIMNLLIIPPLLLVLGVIAFVYIYLIVKGVGEIRSSSFFIFVGLLLSMGSWAIHSQFGRRGGMEIGALIDIFGIVCPIFIIVGLLITAYGFMHFQYS